MVKIIINIILLLSFSLSASALQMKESVEEKDHVVTESHSHEKVQHEDDCNDCEGESCHDVACCLTKCFGANLISLSSSKTNPNFTYQHYHLDSSLVNHYKSPSIDGNYRPPRTLV